MTSNRGERHQTVYNEFKENRLGANYERYNPSPVQEFNNLSLSKHHYQSAFSVDNNAQLSVAQEPSIEYAKVEYFLKVSSSDRDATVHPSGSSFSIDLPKEYKNVYSIELIQAIIPDQNNVTQEPYLVLHIDETESTMAAIDKNTADAFAILMLSAPPLVPGSFISIDARIHENTILYYTTPKARLSRMTVTITDADGDVFEFGGDGTTAKAYQSTFFFKIVQLERNTSKLNLRNVF